MFQAEKQSHLRRELSWAGSFDSCGLPLAAMSSGLRLLSDSKMYHSYVARIKVGCFLCSATSVPERYLFRKARGGMNAFFRRATDTCPVEGN